MTTNCKTPAPRLRDMIDRDMVAYFGAVGFVGIFVVLALAAKVHQRSNINGAIEVTISDRASLDRVNDPDAQWHGQISWPLGYGAALLCGPDDFGKPRAVVAKVYDGKILDELWADGKKVRPEVKEFCAAALKRKGERA